MKVEKLIDVINEQLADLVTGPLSDTPYVSSEVSGDQQLELWGPGDAMFPSASIDTPKLAHALLATQAEWRAEME